jgi:hypothetical protein
MHTPHFSKCGKSLTLAISARQLIDTTIPTFQVVILAAPRFKPQELAAEIEQLAAFMPGVKLLAIAIPSPIWTAAGKIWTGGSHHILLVSPWKFSYLAETGGLIDRMEIQWLGLDFSKVKYLMFDDITEMTVSNTWYNFANGTPNAECV